MESWTSYSYENKGNRIESETYQTYGGTQTNRYFYRGGSNVVVGANINGTLRQSFTHDSLDRLSSSTVHTDGGELTTSYAYAENTTSGTATTQLKTAASPLENFSFEAYESSGNLSRWRYSNQFWSSIFSASYDKLGQLTTAVWDDHPRTYEYDKHGNILKETVHPFGVGDTVEHNYVYSSDWVDQLISYDGKAITYDNIGNPINYMGKTMTWDYGRRLMSVIDGSNMINFAYDLNGNRIAKNNIRYYYSADGLLVSEAHSGYDINYIYGANGSLLGFKYRGQTYYYHYSPMGDVMAIYTSPTNVVARYHYGPWGELLYIANGSNANVSSDPTHIANINPIRYRGYYYDTETGFYFLQSRYYDPQTHRFINADGYISTGQSILGYNMYVYCGNNPITRADSTGEFWSEIWNFAKEAVSEIWKAMGNMAPAYVGCGVAAVVDGPLPVGDTIGILGAAVITVCAVRYGVNRAIQARDVPIPKVEEKEETTVAPKEPKSPVIFPTDPNTFAPIGLVKTPRAGTKNGALISWMDPITNTEVFRWDENPAYPNGPHYHIYGKGHYAPGTAVPEPYATIYFPNR